MKDGTVDKDILARLVADGWREKMRVAEAVARGDGDDLVRTLGHAFGECA